MVMTTLPEPSLLTITLQQPGMIWCYILYAAIASLFLRGALSFLRAVEGGKIGLGKRFWIAFCGFGDNSSVPANDYWQTFLLGFLEISIFPVLITINKPEYVAGWLVLKTLPQWKYWSDKRNIYNRFLIGNAGILLISWLLARQFFV